MLLLICKSFFYIFDLFLLWFEQIIESFYIKF